MILLVASVYFASSQFMLVLKKYKYSKRKHWKDRGRKTLGYGKCEKNLGKQKLIWVRGVREVLKIGSPEDKEMRGKWGNKLYKALLNQAWIQSRLTLDLIQVLFGPFTVCKMWWNRRPEWCGHRPWTLGKHFASGAMWEDRLPSWPDAGL